MASTVTNCFTYLQCPTGDGILVELGCISTESVSHTPQTSNLPTCRKNNNIRKRVDGIESTANFQLELIDDEDLFLFRYFRRAALACKELRIFYLDDSITTAGVDGDVFLGVVGATWTRNNGEKNMAITQESTGGVQCYDQWLADPNGGNNVAPTVNDNVANPITTFPNTTLPDPKGINVSAIVDPDDVEPLSEELDTEVDDESEQDIHMISDEDSPHLVDDEESNVDETGEGEVVNEEGSEETP